MSKANNVTIAIGRNPLANQQWIVDQIVGLVKMGKSDIFIVNTDQRVSQAVLEALKHYTKEDAVYNQLLVDNQVMFHTTETEDLQTLDDAKMNSRSAILANMLFSLPLLKQCRDLARHHVPVFVSTTPSMSGKIPASANTKFLD